MGIEHSAGGGRCSRFSSAASAVGISAQSPHFMGKKASAPGGTGLQRLVLSRRLTGWPGDGPLLRRRDPAPIPQSRGREVLTDSSGLLECAAAAGGDGRRPGQLGELRRCSAHPCSSGNALGEALVGSRRGGSFRPRYANPRRAAGARRLPAYLRSAGRSRRAVWPAALACWRRPPLLRPGLGSPSEGEWAMSEARNRRARGPWPDQGDVAATGDRPSDLERGIFRMRVVPGLTPGGTE
jgi:hypothetical protein